MVEGYGSPDKVEIALPGPTGRAALEIAVHGLRLKGTASPHDQVVARELAAVLSGGDTDITESMGDDALLALERKAFMSLVRQPATLARMEQMLETGKPLRN
jgi:3-hydroxyacyl-CoA dehydrogenase